MRARAARTLTLTLAAVIVSSAIPTVVFAQDNKTVPLARRLFDEGVAAARSSQWQVALDRFKRSYELAPRLKTLFNLAGAQLQTGNLVDASESYRRFLRETNDGRYEAYRKDARELLDKLEKRIPFATIRVLGVSPGDEVSLDDSSFPQAGLGESMPIDPGSHTVVVRRDGETISTRQFVIAEGDSKVVDIVVEPRPEKVDDPVAGQGDGKGKGAGADLTTGPVDPGKDDEGGGVLSSGWFWTAVAVVAIGGAAGGYFLTRDATADPTAGTLGRGVIDVSP